MKTSPQYALARALIAYLDACKDLAELKAAGKLYLAPAPFDKAEQVSQLELAAGQYEAMLLVSPAGVEAPASAEASFAGVLGVNSAVYVLTTRNLAAPAEPTGWEDLVASLLLSWLPERGMFPVERPWITQAIELDMDASKDFPNHQNLRGICYLVQQKINYRSWYSQLATRNS